MGIDFPTALARLLRDGALRDRFACDQEAVIRELGVLPEEAGSFRQFSSDDLEYQAAILIRKRFDACRYFLRGTLAKLGNDAFAIFSSYARLSWPESHRREFEDADAFILFLRKKLPSMVSRMDENRLRFLQRNRRVAVNWSSEIPARRRFRRGWQIFYRNWRGGFHEWTVAFGL